MNSFLKLMKNLRKKESNEQDIPTTTAPISQFPTSNFHTNNLFRANPSPKAQRLGNEAPPSYREATKFDALQIPHTRRRNASSSSSIASAVTIESVTRAEDPYAFLSSFDTVFVIDDSGSMVGRHWREVREILQSITPICVEHDADGIDIYFLNHRSTQSASPQLGKPRGGYRNINNLDRVNALFDCVRPTAATPLGATLQMILKPYTKMYAEKSARAEAHGESEVAVKPMNVIVITDGEASDPVEEVIATHAKKLDMADAPPYQVGIQFFQVGNIREAREFLRGLDDDLAKYNGGIRDMVDTMTWNGSSCGTLTAEGILKAVLGAVIRRIDRRRLSVDGGCSPSSPGG